MVAGVVNGQADAISMWEPDAQKTIDALGSDAIVFQDNKVYRALFTLYTSTDVLNDRARRQQLVSFVRALLASVDEMKTKPEPHFR
jgi:hypothetical protein